MNLIGYTATALSRNDIEDTPTNKNVVDFAIVELKDLQGNLVVMYDDAEGANPETQKVCDDDGQVTFFAEVGDYNVEINGKAQRINLAANIADYIKLATGESVQEFADSFALKIFKSPTDGGLTEIQTRTVGANEVYEVRKASDDSLATIYSDSAGTSEISQDGVSNVSDSDGRVDFYTADGDYTITANSVTASFVVGVSASRVMFNSGDSVETVKQVLATNPNEAKDSSTRLKALGGGSIKFAYNEDLQLSQAITFTGEFSKGFTVDGGRNRFTTELGVSGLLVTNKVGDIASEYFNKAKFVDFEFIGSGATATPVSYGFTQRAAAGINTYNLRAVSFNIGMLLDGALTSNHYSPVIRSNGIGINAKPFVGTGGLNSFSPNANNFFGAQIQRNNQAVNYDNNPSGAVNWFGITVENNNQGGNDTDGVQVFKLTNAGHHNIIGGHFESNLGQYGIWFDGANANKNLLVAGSEIIHGTDTVLHVEQGMLTAVASRITNNGATNDINLQTGASATLIDSEARVSGDLSKTVGVKFGRIKFGGNPVGTDPLISATPSAIVGVGGQVSIFSADYINHTWRNSAGARMGAMSFSDGGNWAFTKDGATGYSFNANGDTKFYISRAGGSSVEPGSDNSTSVGSGALRFTQVFASNGTINTSDEREKQQIEELTPELLAVAKRLMKLNKTYKWSSSVDEKGGDARTHVGLIAQDVISAFEAEGLDAFKYGAVCYDEWDDEYEKIEAIIGDDGEIAQEEKTLLRVKAGSRYGLRFQQLNELRFAYINKVLSGM